MKKGSYLLNASRGIVVVIDALVEKLKEKHLAGAAIDVFPEEPSSNKEIFKSPLQNLPYVILTPHIGGSTEEAQYLSTDEKIGYMVMDVSTQQLDKIVSEINNLTRNIRTRVVY